jgi:hypothetical protein
MSDHDAVIQSTMRCGLRTINEIGRSLSHGVPAVQSSASAGKQQTPETNAGTCGVDATTHADVNISNGSGK